MNYFSTNVVNNVLFPKLHGNGMQHWWLIAFIHIKKIFILILFVIDKQETFPKPINSEINKL